MLVWTLIVTLHYGTPEAKKITAQENIASWGQCVALGSKFMRAFKPPVAVTCQPTDVKA